MMKRVSLFNVEGSDSYDDQALVGGNPTGIANLNQQRYGWVNPLYRTMIGNFWIPQKVSLTEDRITLNMLSEDEDSAVRDTLSFLIFLDSFQTNNLPNISDYITNQGVKNLIPVQVFQEVIHSESYQYILESLYPSMERDAIYNRWRDNTTLMERNKTIADIATRFLDNPTKESFIDVVVANLALEGVYFYQGFNLFDQLAHRKKLVQTAKVIDYIRRDELTHVNLFANILKEFPVEEIKDPCYRIFEEAVEQEINWCRETYGNKILGISNKSSSDFVKYLADDRLKRVGLEPIFGSTSNPYQHIEQSQSEGNKRENFFESGAVTSYDTADSVDGWDDL